MWKGTPPPILCTEVPLFHWVTERKWRQSRLIIGLSRRVVQTKALGGVLREISHFRLAMRDRTCPRSGISGRDLKAKSDPASELNPKPLCAGEAKLTAKGETKRKYVPCAKEWSWCFCVEMKHFLYGQGTGLLKSQCAKSSGACLTLGSSIRTVCSPARLPYFSAGTQSVSLDINTILPTVSPVPKQGTGAPARRVDESHSSR